MSDVSLSAHGATGAFILPLREGKGRYRDYRRTTGPVDPNFQATLRDLLQRSCHQALGLAEIAGRIYLTRLFVSSAEPGMAYVEVDGNRVPVDQPQLEPVMRGATEYVRVLRAKCQVSDALTPDTRVPLQSAFVPPNFMLSESEQSRVISWQRLRDYPRVVLTGEPGSGKTSCLRRLALDITSGVPVPSDTLPVFIQLRESLGEGLTPQGISRMLGAYDMPDLDADLKSPLHGGRLLLMIDGLDELPGQTEQDEFVQRLARLCEALPCVRVIITTRNGAQPAGLPDFTRIQILPFDNPKIEQWALDYLASQDLSIRRHEFVELLHYDLELNSLVQNPLLLSLASSLHWKSPDELNDRVGFLRKCLEVLVQDWDAVRGVARWRRSEITSRQINTLAGYLSERMVQSHQDHFSVDELDQIFDETTEFREHASTLLSACQTSGLVRDVGDGRYCFTHRSFEDYFAASRLIRMPSDVQEIIQTYSTRRTERNFWALSCALASQADGLLEAVMRSKTENSGALAIMLAQAFCHEISASEAVIDQCSARIVAVLERLLRKTKPLSTSRASALYPGTGNRHIAWVGGVVADSATTSSAEIDDAAELVKLLHRARSGVARQQLVHYLECSSLPAVWQVANSMQNDGWCTSTTSDDGHQRFLSLVVTRSAAVEAERRSANITSAGNPLPATPLEGTRQLRETATRQTPSTDLTSLSFAEEMNGTFTAVARHGVFGAPGQGQPEPIAFRLTITAEDVDRFLNDPEHAARAEGWIDSSSFGGRRQVQRGWFNLFAPDGAPDHRLMHYRLQFADASGQPRTVTGVKDIFHGPPSRIWPDTSTLHIKLLEGHVDAGEDDEARILATGTLHLRLTAFARQLTTFRAKGANAAVALERFGRLFAGQLWDVYGSPQQSGPATIEGYRQ